jgi:hypothetical protein
VASTSLAGAERAAPPLPLAARDEVQLDRRLGHRLHGPQRVRRLEVALVEALAEDMADDLQQLGARAVAPGQRQAQRCAFPPCAEELHVCVAKAVDGLARVAHEHSLAVGPDERIQQPALQPIGVLELVHEHEVEALAHLVPDLGALEQLAGALLEVVEVECELGVLARAVGLAIVREERRDRRSDLVLEAAAGLELRDGEQVAYHPGGLALGRREREQLAIAGRSGQQRLDASEPAEVADGLRAIVAGQLPARRASRLAQRSEQLRAGLRRGQQGRGGAGGAQARVEAPNQRARAVDAVLAEQIEHHRVAGATLARDRIAEGGLREHERLGLVQYAQLGRQPGLRGVLAQETRRQCVDRADLRPGSAAAGGQRPLEAQGELARRRLGVGHDEHALGRRAQLQRRAHPRDHERGLARARAGRDDDLSARLDREALLLAEGRRERVHGLATRQTPCQRHHDGHSPSGGSCSRSPTFMRPENSAARSPASSSSCWKASGST